MEKMNFSVDMTSVAEYINQVGNGELVRAFAGSAPSIKYLEQQLGVNEKTDLHLLKVAAINLHSAKNCEFNDDDSLQFSDRQIDPAYIKAETAICANEMVGKWMAYKERLTASENNLPFAEEFAAAYVEAFGEKLEALIWGDTTNIDGQNVKGFRGIAAEGVAVPTDGSESDVYDYVRKVILSIPAKQFKKTEIFVSPEDFLLLKDGLLKRDFRLMDLTFTNGTEVDENTIKMPVFGTLVHAVDGLAGTNEIIALVPEHAVYGTSVEGAHTDVRLVYDEVNDRYIMRIKMTAGVQVVDPAEVLHITH